MKKSIYNYEGVWTLSTQNGQCYHMGRVKQLQEVYPGDTGKPQSQEFRLLTRK